MLEESNVFSEPSECACSSVRAVLDDVGDDWCVWTDGEPVPGSDVTVGLGEAAADEVGSDDVGSCSDGTDCCS